MRDQPPFRIERLAGHSRQAFDCGDLTINTWFRGMASQQVNRDLAAVHVLIDQATSTVAGFYALCNFTVNATDLPDFGGKKLPALMPIPMHLIGHLGIHKPYQHRGMGRMLVNDALKRAESLSRESGSLGVVVHALDASLVPWYRQLGFLQFPEHPLQLVMTMAAIRLLP
jgi:GNAT superfamily N-acetyltransferase